MLFDPLLVESLVDLVPMWLVLVLVLLSYLGSAVLLTPIATGWYLYRPNERTLGWLGLLFGAYSLRTMLKGMNDIGRPVADPGLELGGYNAFVQFFVGHPIEIASTAFPSGHVIAGIVWWGALAADLDRFTRRTRMIAAAAVIAIIAFSRVLVGAHFIEDVVGAAIVATAFLLGMLWIRKRTNEFVILAFAIAGLFAIVRLTFSPDLTAGAVAGVVVGVFAALLVLRGNVRRWTFDLGNGEVGMVVLGTILVGLVGIRHGADPLPPTVAVITALACYGMESGLHTDRPNTWSRDTAEGSHGTK